MGRLKVKHESGKVVKWTSTSSGKNIQREGVIIAYVKPKTSALALIPSRKYGKLPKSRVRITDLAKDARYLIAVKLDKFGAVAIFAPLAAAIHKDNPIIQKTAKGADQAASEAGNGCNNG